MSTEQAVKMPFGKHRGKPVAEIPESYLRWLHETVELREPLKGAVAAALSRAAGMTPSGVPGSTPAARSSSVGIPTPSSARSMGSQRGFPGSESPKPKPRAWRTPEGENLSEYFSNGADDGIGF